VAGAAELSNFSNANLGVTFAYPSALDQLANGTCRPQAMADGTAIEVGPNINIRREDTGSATLAQHTESFLTQNGASEQSRKSVMIDASDAIGLDYRLTASARAGAVTLIARGKSVYLIVFEARNITACDGMAGANLYASILSSVKFRP
jgi:hypothetical protein